MLMLAFLPPEAFLPTIKNMLLTMLELADLFLPLYLMAKCTINMRTGLEREYIAYLEGFKDSIREYNTHGQTNSSQYFYNVLPYAMTLGMKDELVRKYENIVFYPPKWLKSRESGKTFSVSSFVSRLYEGV